MPNSLSKQKMPAWEKLLPMRITGRIFFNLYKEIQQFDDLDRSSLFSYVRNFLHVDYSAIKLEN